MKKITTAIFIFSICFGSDQLPKNLLKYKSLIQKKYNIHSIQDLNNLKQSYPFPARSSSRQMGDLLGEWSSIEQKFLFHVTVGTDQSLVNPMSLSGMIEGEGHVTATHSDWTTELTYLFNPDMMDGGDDDDQYCEPCDGAGGCGNYYVESECLATDGCEWYGSDGPGCDNCEPCDGAGGCGSYYVEGECIAVDGCEWYGWQDGPGCSGNNIRTRTHSDTLIFDNWPPDMNYPRYGSAYTTDGQYIYAFNGAEYDVAGDSSIWHKHGERYFPAGDGTWESFPAGNDSLYFNTPRRYASAEYVNGKIYIFNGNQNTNVVDIIDVSTGTVSTSPTNPYPVYYGGSAVWNEKIYIFGGSYYTSDSTIFSNRLYVFDPQDESWAQLADMPNSKNTNGVIVDGVLYTFGGYNGTTASSDIDAYYIDSDVWENIGQMPVPLSSHSIATDGSLIFVSGDYNNNIEFSGVYDVADGVFHDKTSNMIGRRHGCSVYLDDGLFVYGGNQPEGYNENESTITLSNVQYGELIDTDDGEDEGAEVLIMNMNLMEFVAIILGLPFDSLGIDNPTVIGVYFDESENGDIVVDWIDGALFVGSYVLEIEPQDDSDISSMVSLDTTTWTISFDNLNLYDSAGVEALSLSGAIGPSMWDFIAGVPTVIDMQGEFMDDDASDLDVYLYGDSTGMEILTEYDDYYYYEPSIDTNYFQWFATSDSLFIAYEPDEYYESDSMALTYSIEGDTLFTASSSYPCQEAPFDYYDECLESLADQTGLGELDDIEEFKFEGTNVLVAEEYYVGLDQSDITLPEKFNLYPNFPNPFNPVTTIRFDIGSSYNEITRINIYDISGKKVATLINEKLQNGTYNVIWDASGFASGLYFSELTSGSHRQTQKLILLK